MSYNTTEAYIEDTKIIFSDNSFIPKTRTKVLVTFIEDDLDWNLYELDRSKVTEELLKWSKRILNKDKSLFTNI